MESVNYNIRLNKQIGEQADELYQSMGLSLSSAINLFLTQSVIQGKLPIGEIVADPVYIYTEELLRDAEETDRAVTGGAVKLYHNLDELFAEWRHDGE